MEDHLREQLLKNRSQLVNMIEVNNGFYEAMKAIRLITTRQESRIKNSGDSFVQVETLLDLMPRLGRDAFRKFCQVLKDTGQERVVETLLTPPGATNHTQGDKRTMTNAKSDNISRPTGSSLALVDSEYLWLMVRVWLDIAERSRIVIKYIPDTAQDYLDAVTGKPGTAPTSDIPMTYSAPELFQTPPQHSHKTDIWAIGCVIIHLLTGRSPWHDKAKTPEELKKHVTNNPSDIKKYIPEGSSKEVKDLLDHMVAAGKGNRWTASHLLKHDLLKGERSSELVPPGQMQSDVNTVVTHGIISASNATSNPDLVSKSESTDKKQLPTDTSAKKASLQKSTQQFFIVASRTKLTEMELNLSEKIPSLISDTNHSWSELWDLFKRLSKWDYAPFLGMKEGMTVLHQIVYHNRVSFLDVIFNLGAWPKLIDVYSEGGPAEYQKLTAMEMAQKMNRSQLWKEMDKINRLEDSMNLWHKASRAGNEADIDKLLSQNPSPYVVNEPSMNGKTPIYWAVTKGNYNIIDKLVQKGADVYCHTEDGDTLLTRAVSLNHDHLVRPLVSEWGLSVDQHGLNKKSPIYIASENGHLQTFKALLNVGATLNGVALISATMNGKTQFMKVLMDEYHLHPSWQDIMGKAPILAAAAAGQNGSIDTLLSHGADVTMADKRKRNIIHFAVEGGSETTLKKVIKVCKEKKVLQRLLDAQDVYSGAESIFLVKGKDQGRPAWHYVQVRRIMLQKFRDKTQGGPIDVANYGSVVQSGWGAIPPITAVNDIERQYSPDQIPPNAPTDLSPLMLAIMKGHHNMVLILLKENPKLETRDCYGLTAFHLACMKGSVNTVKALVQAGCQTEVQDAQDRTPLKLAQMNDHTVIVNFLEGCKDMQHVEKFVAGGLARAHRALDSRSLEQEQAAEKDLRRYAVEHLRELQADINQVLYDLGSAPIGQASEEPAEDTSQG